MKRGPIRLVLVSTCFLFGMQAKTQTVTTLKEILPNAWYVDGSVYFLKGKPDLTFSNP